MTEPDGKRRIFMNRGLRGLAALVALESLPLPAMAFFPTTRKLPPDRFIHRVQGDVLVDGTPAHQRTVITPASSVHTGKRSQIVFRVGRDAYLLRENSGIELSSDDGIVVDGLRLLTGSLLSVFSERPAGRSLRLSTPEASIGIRGTGIYVESEARLTYVCTCYGEVELGALDDPATSETIRTEHHEAPRYVLSEARNGQRITEAPMKNHTDAELTLIEAIVGRKPPFTEGNAGDRDY